MRSMVLLAALAAGCSGENGGSVGNPPELVVIGIDGLDVHSVDELGSQGKLPNLTRLIKRGVYSEIRSIDPLVSPAIWTTIASGKNPEKHGVWDWVTWGGWEDRMVHGGDVRVRRYWEILDSRGYSCATLAWLMTYPLVPSEHGLTVSTRLLWDDEAGKITNDTRDRRAQLPAHQLTDRLSPEDDLPWVRVLFPTKEELEASPIAAQVPHVPLDVHPWARDEYTVRVALDALERRQPQVLTAYLKGIDEMSHLFWVFKDSSYMRRLRRNPMSYALDSTLVPGLTLPWMGQPMDDEKIALAEHMVDDYIIWSDAAVGRILDKAGGAPNVIILSDHGFFTQQGVVNHGQVSGIPAADHRMEGTLILSGPAFDPKAKLYGPSMVDITPTILHLLGQPVAKDMDGRVLVEAFEDDTPITWIDTYENEGLQIETRGAVDAQADEMERLRTLGYIDDP